MTQQAEILITRRVLVADDDPFYREIAVATLMEAGYEVIAAGDGNEAIEAIRTTPVDIAILDVEMPGMTGVEVIAQVRAGGAQRHIPMVVITGNDDTESIEKAYEAGATSFLAKPLNWPLFVQHVNFVLKAAQAETDLRDAIRTAEFLSDLKTRVVSVLMGEFQSPLRTAQGMSELLRKEVYGPLGHRLYLEYAEDLHTALDQLNSIQLKMMNSSRAMSGELLLKEESVPLRQSVLEAIHAMRGKADRRGIDIELRDSLPTEVFLNGDRSLISQAIKMLLESAIASSPRNIGIVMDIRLDSEGAFSLSVEDGAPALPETLVRDIMGTGPVVRQVAQQVTVSRNTSLTISRVVAEAHEGKMTLTSAMGEGTIVRLRLPKERLSVGSALPQAKAAPLVPHDLAAMAPMRPQTAAQGATLAGGVGAQRAEPPALRISGAAPGAAGGMPRA